MPSDWRLLTGKGGGWQTGDRTAYVIVWGAFLFSSFLSKIRKVGICWQSSDFSEMITTELKTDFLKRQMQKFWITFLLSHVSWHLSPRSVLLILIKCHIRKWNFGQVKYYFLRTSNCLINFGSLNLNHHLFLLSAYFMLGTGLNSSHVLSILILTVKDNSFIIFQSKEKTKAQRTLSILPKVL